MDSQTIRTALGKLQVDPDSRDEWAALKAALGQPDGDLNGDDLAHLLDAAREQHERRGEWGAVAELLRLEIDAAPGSLRERPLLARLLRVAREELYDEAAAEAVLRRLLEIDPEDPEAQFSLEELASKRQRYEELEAQYLGEAENAPDEVYKSSMLMRAAEMRLRYAPAEADRKPALERLEHAVRLDGTNVAAAKLLELVYRQAGRWEELAPVLERISERADNVQLRAQASLRLARTAAWRLNDKVLAARAYEAVLGVWPAEEEAKSFLAEYYSAEERWDELVALYERELATKDISSADQLGDMLQIAMLHWKKRQRAHDAEAWFERIRRIDAAQPLMLNFYREYAAVLEDDGRLIEVLQGAQRVMKEGPNKRAISVELAKLAEGQKNAQRAIEQYKSLLRQDPENVEAREALKRLYKQTQSHNALVELLRQQLERTPPDEYATRLGILRDVATVYRQYIKSDTALVSVLNQIVQLDEKLDEHDVEEMRELVQLYEKLGRWRDLLTNQLKLAEITPDVEEKKVLFRGAARRWLEQFSNVQNATEAYEALLKVAPDDREARERLHELYQKRRAWPALYDLYASELGSLTGDARLGVLKEMAQLAAERLGRSEEAVRLYREIVEADPSRVDALDALEKHAERSKDWRTLAEALERRVNVTADDSAKLNVLQKLGTVYAEQLGDHAAAARAWRRILELQPHHHRALRVLRDTYLQAGDYDGLAELYASQNDWEGLAEVLSGAADRARDNGAKVELSYRAAAVYEDQLGQPDRAFRSYERILSVTPNDAKAGRALIPLYERDEKWARLPALYELVYDHSEDEDERLALLRKLVEVTGARLNDRKAAVNYARRAYQGAPGNPLALELLERAARAAGSWDQFVESLEGRLMTMSAAALPEAQPENRGKRGKKKRRATEDTGAHLVVAEPESRVLRLKLARVYAEELGQTDRAIATYRALLEQDPTDHEAGAALEHILRRSDRRDDLRWLLDLRVRHTPSDADRIDILRDWAVLEEDAFESPEGAIAIHRRILEIAPNSEPALRALPRLLLAQGDAEAAVAVIEQHRQHADFAQRSALDVHLAELYATRLDRPELALEAALRAVEAHDEQSRRAMGVLEDLLKDPRTRARAAEILAAEYHASGDSRREAHAVAALLEQTAGTPERRALYHRLADIHEEKLHAFSTALDVMLRAVRELPQDLELWDRADVLATKSGRPTDLAEAFREALHGEFPPNVQIELCERAARLHEDKLGDPIGATPYLEKVLTLEPGSEQAFQHLKDILTAAERWGELQGLYDRAVAATTDPARRTDLLVEVALICEEITEEPQKATRYYERILEVEPQHEATLRALDRLYVRQGRHADLAALLDRRLASAGREETLDLKLRLARIQLERLHQPDQAITHVEDVIDSRINDYEARELAEKMLEIGSLRPRAARILEAVYENRDEIRDLVRVLEIRLEGYRPVGSDESDTLSDPLREEERKDLLRRVAQLRDERLHDSEGALHTLAQLVPADPRDSDARERLLEVGRRLSAFERVAEVLTRAADRAEEPALKAEILMTVAAITEEQLQQPERAASFYVQVTGLDENEPSLVLPAAQALERLYRSSGEHQKLVEVLRAQVRLEADVARRRQLLGQIGELCGGTLQDLDGAIRAWSQRLEDDPGDEDALRALDDLYGRAERYRELVEILERRRDVTVDPGLRRTLMVRTAQTLAGQLGDFPRAIEAWRAILDEFGPTTEVLTALEGLYRRAERWEELAETYETHLGVAETDAERLELLAQLGELKREHLRDLEGALEAHRRALTLDTSYAPSRHALESLLDSGEAFARREAAQILLPIYESEGEHLKLLRVLEIEVDTTDDPHAKVEQLEKAADVAEGALGDPNRAFAYTERILRVAVGHVELGPRLGRLERLADVTARQADQVRLLCEVVPEIFDGDTQLTVTLRIAELARHRLSDRELARRYYQKALELRADDKTALSALESLYEETGDSRSLLEILERRIEVAESEAEKKQLMFRRARLLADVLGEKHRASEAYEAILDLELEPSAIAALRTLYAEQERWADSIALYQRELDARLGNPAELRVEMARVLAGRLGDVPRALDELEEALALDRHYEPAIAELERVLGEGTDAEQRARAATLLEPVYLARADYTKVMQAIQARLAFTEDVEERRELLHRLAQLYEEQAEDYIAALETTAKLFHQDITDENSRGELERLAKVAGAERRLGEIYAAELAEVTSDDPVTARLSARTGELFASLAEYDRALGFYRRALAFQPEDQGLFRAIDDILKRTSRHEDRVQLYREALEQRFEPAERLELLHTIAGLERRELGRVDAAIETYRSAVELDEQDTRALDALTELYTEQRRWNDLADLYLRRAEISPSPEQAARFRLSLSLLLRTELADTGRAIDQLEEIVQVIPQHPDAIRELEGLRQDPEQRARVVDILRPIYEAADDWRHLIKLNEDRFELAATSADKVDVLRETARLWEQRGGDRERARRALAVAFELEPNDVDVRAEYERLVAETQAWGELAQIYEGVLQAQPDLPSRRDILVVLARVHDQERDDPRAALGAYERLYETDPSDPEPLNKMEQLATLLSDWPILVRVLVAKAELSLDSDERASLWRRIGEARRDMLEDRPGAIEAYERAVEDDIASTFTIDCLIELHEAEGNAARLVELYQRRVELTLDDDDLRFSLLTAAGRCYEEKLGDRPRAIEMLNQANAVRANDRATLAALNRLYRAEKLWPELLDNLRLQASVAEDPAERAARLKEMGQIQASEQSSFEDAVDSYRQVIEENPTDEEALAEVTRLGREHEELRATVADILIPALSGAGRHRDLVDAHELLLTTQTDPVERSETLQAIARVQERDLGQPDEAQGTLLRALAERPDAAVLHSEIERLAEPGGYRRYADALLERASATFDPEIGRELYTRLGRIAEERLSDDRLAVTAYEKAIEQAGDEPDLLEALDRLYTRLDDPSALNDVLERRTVVETSDADLAELNYRLARLLLERFNDPARALGFLRTALERAPDHEGAVVQLERLTSHRDLFEEAAESLESVYRSKNATDRLAQIYEKRVAFASTASERLERRRELSRVLEDEARNPAAAQRVLEQALGDDPSDAELLNELERLAALTGEWGRAAEALNAALDSTTVILPEIYRELSLRLTRWYRDQVGDSAAAEHCLVRALEHDPASDELLQALEELQRAPGRERELVATLRRRAKLELSEHGREQLYRQAKGLADSVGDAALAEAILRELLQQDDQNTWALAELTQLREAAGDHRETYDLYLRRAELRAEGDLVRELLHRAALLARGELGEPNSAIRLYEQLFEDEPTDVVASGALRELYERQRRTEDLVRLLDRLVDLADDASQRSELRMQLSRLHESEFSAHDRAIDLLREILYDEPSHAGAVVRLSELLEKTNRDEELAELLNTQIEAAHARGDTSAELTFQVRLAEIYDARLHDRGRAIATYRSVLERDPSHRAALSALARLLRVEERHEEASEVLERLLEQSTGADAVAIAVELASVYEQLGRGEDATRALERGVAAEPGNTQLRAQLRQRYEGASQWDKLGTLISGNADLTDAVEDKVRLLREAAAIYSRRRGDHAAAAELLERASQLKPADRDVLLALCDEYSASGRGRDAASVLERIVESYGGKRSRELGDIHRRLADAYLAEGQKQRALEELDKAFRIEPGNVGVLKRLGEVALDAGDYKKAQQMFRALLLQKLEGDVPITKAEVFYYLGETHLLLDEKPKAIQMYERAVQQDDAFTRAKTRLAELKG